MRRAFSFVFAAVFIYGCDCSHDHDHAGDHAEGHAHHAEGHAHHDADECGGAGSDHGGRAHAKKSACREDSHRAKTLEVSEGAQSVMGMRTVRAEKRDVASMFVCPGRYELQPDARESVATPVAGRLGFAVKPLAVVRKGDALFTVTSPDLVARSREITVLEKRLAVYDGIKTRNAALENALAVKKAERAALLAGAAEKDGVITVRAAKGGLVDSFKAKNGDWLDVGETALETVRPKELRFKALVASRDAARLEDGLEARVGRFSGEVRLGVGDDSGLVPVYVVFGGEIDAVAGERAEASVTVSSSAAARTAVPSKCIVTIALQPTVFVKDETDPTRFTAVDVTPLGSCGGWTAVEGLADGAEVVLDGAYELKLALPGAEKESSGHFHADGTFHEGEH